MAEQLGRGDQWASLSCPEDRKDGECEGEEEEGKDRGRQDRVRGEQTKQICILSSNLSCIDTSANVCIKHKVLYINQWQEPFYSNRLVVFKLCIPAGDIKTYHKDIAQLTSKYAFDQKQWLHLVAPIQTNQHITILVGQIVYPSHQVYHKKIHRMRRLIWSNH